MKNRDAYVEKMKLQLDAMNQAISDMEEKANAAQDDATDAYHAALRDVRAQSNLARDKVDELMASGEASWDSAVAQMEKLRDAFTHSLKDFKSQL
jgi:hypothetical protein